MSQPTQTLQRIAIYQRVSSEEQVQGFSLDAQEKACRAWAAARGCEVAEVYTDPGFSAKTDKRPAFRRMIADGQAGRFTIVLVHKFDRFARNRADAVGYKALLKKAGVSVLSVSEPIDPDDPAGVITEGMLEVVAEWYLAQLSRETTKGKRERAEQGYQNNQAPFGYTKAKGKDEVAQLDPVAIDGYRMAVSKSTAGLSDLKIAWALNDAGYRTTKGRLFSKDTVAAMLHSRFYLGEVFYKRQWFGGRHAPAIDDETWGRMHLRRAERAIRPDKARVVGRSYPLTKVLYCAECGRGMCGNSLHDVRYYRDTAKAHGLHCSQRSVRADLVEEQFSNFISELKLPDDWQHQALKMLGQDPDEVARVERLRRQLEGERDRIKKLFIAGDLSDSEYNHEKARIQSGLNNLVAPTAPDLTLAAALLANFGRLWQVANGDERKRLVTNLVARVWVKDGAIMAIEPKAAAHFVLMAQGDSTPVGSAGDMHRRL